MMKPPSPLASSAGSARLLFFGLFSLAAALGAFGMWQRQARRQSEGNQRQAQQHEVAAGLPIEVAQATARGLPRTVGLPGDVRAMRQVVLYAKVGGYLDSMAVDKGDSVTKGQLLAVVKSPESDETVRSLRAALQAKVQLVRRYRGLIDRGVVSAQEMDKASADLGASRAELKRYEALRDYEDIRAPYDGTITARYVDPGALISAATGSTEAAQPLLELADTTKVRIYVYVGQAEASFVHVGDVVHLSGDDDVPLRLDAPITRVAHALDVRTRTMLAEIDLDNAKLGLVPGIFLHVRFDFRDSDTVRVPSNALFLRNGQPLVARLDAQRRVHLTPVEVGNDDGHQVHILAGLQAGDWVGVSVGDDVDEGSCVQPRQGGKAIEL